MVTTRYTVTSDRLTAARGETVTGDQLEGCNIAALIEGGHLAPEVFEVAAHKALAKRRAQDKASTTQPEAETVPSKKEQ